MTFAGLHTSGLPSECNPLSLHRMNTPTLDQLKRALVISEQIAALEKELAGILGNHSAPVAKSSPAPVKKKGMSAKARALISAAQKLRWAKVKGKKAPVASKAPAKAKAQAPVKKKSKMSAEGRAKIAAAMKKRWADAKAGKGPAPTASKKK